MRLYIIFLLIFGLICAPATLTNAAQTSAPTAGSTGEQAEAKAEAGKQGAKPENKAGAASREKVDKSAKEQKPEDDAKKEKAENEFSCKYYKATLPEGWRAVLPPTEKQGNVHAIFAATSGDPVVSIIIGPNGGADAKTIAEVFAEQFKAPKPPSALKNGGYSFSFPIQDSTAQAHVAVLNKEFVLTYISGNVRQARNFIKNSIVGENLAGLLPQ